MVLYHLIWGHVDLLEGEPVLPKVPVNTFDDEDKTIARICVAQTLDDCLTGIGPSHIGAYCLLDFLKQRGEDVGLVTGDLELPFTVVKFEVDRSDPDVWLPGKVAEYVPDAFKTQECWLTGPFVPVEVSHRWLVGGEVVQSNFLFRGEKLLYNMISNSVWSDEAVCAESKFVDDILLVTKTWLEQEMPEAVVQAKNKGTLADKIAEAQSECVFKKSVVCNSKVNKFDDRTDVR